MQLIMELPKRIDAFIESDDEDLGRDWLKIGRGVKNDGFRTGMESSHEESLQAGFNAGFREAMQMALAGGRLQGGICANLSYASGDISKAVASLSSIEVAPLNFNQSGGSFTSSPLQSLLTSSNDLISNIPSLLQNNLIKNISLQPVSIGSQPDSASNSENNPSNYCLKKAPELEYLQLFPASKECSAVDTLQGTSEQKGSHVDEQTQALSCEHVCNSKSHFWSQLENFKMQAQSLEVLSAHD